MLKKRIIPRLLSHNYSNQLVASTSLNYYRMRIIGSLKSQLDILESNFVDEICVINLDHFDGLDFSLYTEIFSGLCTPISFGGGINDLKKAHQAINIGADKLMIGFSNQKLILYEQIANTLGSQSLSISLDYSESDSGIKLKDLPDSITAKQLIPILKTLENLGCGEIVLNCMNRDGKRSGLHDLLISSVKDKISVPLIAASGAGTPIHFADTFGAGADGVIAGTYFTLKDQTPIQLRNSVYNLGFDLKH